MTVALDENLPPDLLENLIVADIAPISGTLSCEFRAYTRAMNLIEERKVTTRKEADIVLQDIEKVCSGN